MRDVLPALERWVAEGRSYALAIVTQTWGSSPRPLGSVMGIRDDGVIVGSVSGGCVESAVIDEALKALQDKQLRELKFDALDADAIWDVGLSCGGSIRVWIDPQPVSRDPLLWQAITERLSCDRPCVIATSLVPFEQRLWTPEGAQDGELAIRIEGAYRSRSSGEVEAEGRRWFLHVLPSRERLIIVGAVHIAVPLVRFARELGFETVIIDPRSTFASEERFPSPPDKMISQWPDQTLTAMDITEETYAVVLTHDPKLDDAALKVLLRSPAAYIGALGSRTTQARRRETLSELGFSGDELDRIHGPVGLPIGARTPEEIALAIMAEIVQVRRARS
jgi:xanthine dehydrogenase accessory factor